MDWVPLEVPQVQQSHAILLELQLNSLPMQGPEAALQLTGTPGHMMEALCQSGWLNALAIVDLSQTRTLLLGSRFTRKDWPELRS